MTSLIFKISYVGGQPVLFRLTAAIMLSRIIFCEIHLKV